MNNLRIRTTFFLFLIFATNVYAQEIIDLGTVGFSCEIKERKLVKNQVIGSDIDAWFQSISKQEINLKYKSKLSKGQAQSSSFILQNDPFFGRKQVIYVFAPHDQDSIEKATVKADYGLCVDYNSIDDLDEFRHKTHVKYPIQLANDSILSYLRIKSYPAVVRIENGEVTIETDF